MDGLRTGIVCQTLPRLNTDAMMNTMKGWGPGILDFIVRLLIAAADSFYCKQDCEDYQPYYE